MRFEVKKQKKNVRQGKPRERCVRKKLRCSHTTFVLIGAMHLGALKDMLVRLLPTIVALQEVTLDVFGALFDWFTSRGYACNYKSAKNFQPSNGYGVCIFSLVPIDKSEMIPFHTTTMVTLSECCWRTAFMW